MNEYGIKADQVEILQPGRPWMGGALKLNVTHRRGRVTTVDLGIGYMHRGFEKLCEEDSYMQSVPRAGRLSCTSSVLNEVAYCLAVEKLLGVAIPERSAYLRTMACEFSRIADHLRNIGDVGCQLGVTAVSTCASQAKDLLYDLLEGMTGARGVSSYARIGGVKSDLPDGFETIVRKHFKKVRAAVKNMDDLLKNNRFFIDRMRSVGCVTSQAAIQYGTSGVFLRSAGIEHDVRKDDPYLVYDRLTFDVPVGSRGDNLDRYRLRMEEIRQSMSLVEQVIEKMPHSQASKQATALFPMKAEQMADRGKAGYMQGLDEAEAVYAPFNERSGRRFWKGLAADRPDVSLPAKEEVYGSIEGMIRHFNLWMTGKGIAPEAGQAYASVEGVNGEAGFYVLSDGTTRPYRVRFRSPSFPIVSALRVILIGQDLADILTILVSTNVMNSEFDR